MTGCLSIVYCSFFESSDDIRSINIFSIPCLTHSKCFLFHNEYIKTNLNTGHLLYYELSQKHTISALCQLFSTFRDKDILHSSNLIVT